jgi:hypothetical protein
VRVWRDGKLQELLKKYEPQDIYNADETGLFWMMLPDNCLGFAGKSHHGQKQPKVRITLLVSANMDGSDKLPLLVIGKSAKPRAFKGVKVPVDYTSNKKAWMTGAIFEDWMRQLDKKMTLKGRKIVMIVDNCSAHPPLQMKSIELVFLPPNTTSVTQPMDAGIIRNLKIHYRYILSNRRLEASDIGTAFKCNILDAVIAAKTAWNHVTPSTIQNCYRKAGFRREDLGEQPEVEDDEFVTPFRNVWDRLRDVYGDAVPQDLDDYIDADRVTETSVSLTDAEIVEHINNPGCDKNMSDEEDDNASPVTIRDAYTAVRTLRVFGLKQGIDDIEDWMDNIETALMKRSDSLRQTKITDFTTNQ